MFTRKNLSKPTKAKKYNTDPAFRPIARHWEEVDWLDVITCNSPVLKLKLEDTEDDWALISMVDLLATDTDIAFADAASWVLHQALGLRVDAARRMSKGEIGWDPEILYVCRVMASLLCIWKNPEVPYALEQIDRMIRCLLITEDELLAEASTANKAPC